MKRIPGVVVLLAIVLLVIAGCRTQESSKSNTQSGDTGLQEGSGYRIAGQILFRVKAETPLPIQIQASVLMALSARVEKIVKSVACIKITLESLEIKYENRYKNFLSPILRRLALPPSGSSVRIWVDREHGEFLSIQKAQEVIQLTHAESVILALLGFPRKDTFQPLRVSIEKPWPFELVYTERINGSSGEYTTLTSRIRITTPETPQPVGECVWIQSFLSQMIPVQTTIHAEFTTRTRIPGGGIRFVVPLVWQIQGVLEYVHL